MPDATAALRLLQRWRGRASVSGPDWGDCGTAFGLEMSMQPEPASPPPPGARPGRDPGWWRHLGVRRAPATKQE